MLSFKVRLLIRVEGRVQREGEVVHVIATRLHDLSGELAGLREREAGVSAAAWTR